MSVSERTVHLQMLNHTSTQNYFAMNDSTERLFNQKLACWPVALCFPSLGFTNSGCFVCHTCRGIKARGSILASLEILHFKTKKCAFTFVSQISRKP